MRLQEPIRLGAVCALPHRRCAVGVARAVMDKSPHNVLVGQGALDYAVASGLPQQDALSPEAEAEYRQWKKDKLSQATAHNNHNNENNENNHNNDRGQETHDTVGLICLDSQGRICAATSTSGWPYKHVGRVGDSALVGSGLYADSRYTCVCVCVCVCVCGTGGLNPGPGVCRPPAPG